VWERCHVLTFSKNKNFIFLRPALSNKSFGFDKLKKFLAIHIDVGLTVQLRKKFCFYEVGWVCCIFVDVPYICLFLIFEIIKLQKLLWFMKKSFRDVALSRNGPGRDAIHFAPFRVCPGQSGTSGHPNFNSLFSASLGLRSVRGLYRLSTCPPGVRISWTCLWPLPTPNTN